jgi:CheY-like chemotaxis protein
MLFYLSRTGGHILNGSKPQILVVDDDPSIRESLGMLLISEGYDVAMAPEKSRSDLVVEQSDVSADIALTSSSTK